jgi:hypothetical protein
MFDCHPLAPSRPALPARREAFIAGVALAVAVLGCQERKPEVSSSSSEAAPEPAAALTWARVIEDYAQLCAGGEGFGAAPAPVTDGAEPSKVAIFMQWGRDAEPRVYSQHDLEPWLAKRPDEVALVVCIVREKQELVHTCQMRITGSEEVAHVEMYDTINTQIVYEARTGKELAREQYELLGTGDCPGSLLVGQTVSWFSAEPTQHLIRALTPLQPDAAPSLTPRETFAHDVCTGKPMLSASPYEPGPDRKAFVRYVFRMHGEGFRTVAHGPSGLFDAMLGTGPPEGTRPHLIACVTGVLEKKMRDCRFDGGRVVEIHAGTYEVEIREASTARVVDRQTFAARGRQCPTMQRFGPGEDRAVLLAGPEPALKKFVASLSDPR